MCVMRLSSENEYIVKILFGIFAPISTLSRIHPGDIHIGFGASSYLPGIFFWERSPQHKDATCRPKQTREKGSGDTYHEHLKSTMVALKRCMTFIRGAFRSFQQHVPERDILCNTGATEHRFRRSRSGWQAHLRMAILRSTDAGS